jgi:electron transport complex protein RnfG
MNQMTKFGLILAAICLAASFVLAVTYKVTKPAIDARAAEEEASALSKILPEADDFIKKEADAIEYYEGYKNKNLVGYCVKAVGNGYGGYFHMIIGIDTSGVIKGVAVLAHQETPGLGAKINEIKYGETEAWFLRQFKGKDASTLSLEDIDAITGATISSQAVVDATNSSINEFLKKVKR